MLKKILLPIAILTAAPSQAKTLGEFIEQSENLTYFNRLAKVAGIEEKVSELQDATVFIPTDDAFKELSVSSIEQLENNPKKLEDILLTHIVKGSYSESDLVESKVRLETYGSYKLFTTYYQRNGQFFYSAIAADCNDDGRMSRSDRLGAQIITTPDTQLDNGVTVHLLDPINPRAEHPFQRNIIGLQIASISCKRP